MRDPGGRFARAADGVPSGRERLLDAVAPSISLRLLMLALGLFALSACQSTGGGAGAAAGLAAGGTDEAATVTDSAAPAAEGDLVPAVEGLPPDPGPKATYRIGPFDLLQVDVFQVDEFSRRYRVNEEGLILMPLVGPVQVGGLTPSEAQDRIADALGRNYLRNPQVSVFVEEFASQSITVAGAVRRPGVYPIKSRTTLLQAIALAEGLTDIAKDEDVVLFRPQEDDRMQAYVINLAQIQRGELRDPPLIADDRVVVPQAGAIVFLRTITGSIRGFVRPFF